MAVKRYTLPYQKQNKYGNVVDDRIGSTGRTAAVGSMRDYYKKYKRQKDLEDENYKENTMAIFGSEKKPGQHYLYKGMEKYEEKKYDEALLYLNKAIDSGDIDPLEAEVYKQRAGNKRRALMMMKHPERDFTKEIAEGNKDKDLESRLIERRKRHKELGIQRAKRLLEE